MGRAGFDGRGQRDYDRTKWISISILAVLSKKRKAERDVKLSHVKTSRSRVELVTLGLLFGAAVSVGMAEDDFERPPIGYSVATPDNAVDHLQARLDAGEESLAHDPRHGYLGSVLEALHVPVSSQTLVFSKTSLQQPLISPLSPRALYFNDDVYVGGVPNGDVVEISVADPALGTVFYTLDQQEVDRPRFQRRTDDCLICHGGAQTGGVPGHVVRSVYPDASGQPIFSAGSYRVDHTTPFVQRWGGWYVTGSHGGIGHLGNRTYLRRPDCDGPDGMEGLNVTSLDDRFDIDACLSPHSDLVALTVLAHQTAAHNAITKASFRTRTALHREMVLNRELGEPGTKRWPSTDTVIESAVEDLVDAFLFRNEAPLGEPIRGTSRFAAEFAAAGPHDSHGRSLRHFDLARRTFRYPCSFLIYSRSFDALPEEVRTRFWKRMDEVLSGADASGRHPHLSASDRSAVKLILAETKPGAPADWRAPGVAQP